MGTGGGEVATFGDTRVTNDTPPPAFVSATVTDASLVMTFDKNLGGGRESGEQRLHGEGRQLGGGVGGALLPSAA